MPYSDPKHIGVRTILPGRGLLLLLVSLPFFAGLCRGQAVIEADEFDAKAALLYNLCKFVKWPEDRLANNESTFVFSVVGDTPLYRALRSIDGKRIAGKRVRIRSISGVNEIGSTRVLCCSTQLLSNLSKQQRKQLTDSHILTVGETDDFVSEGGIVALTVLGEHLSFKINLGAARQAELELSAALLRLAEEIVNP